MTDFTYKIESGTGRRSFGWFVLDVVEPPTQEFGRDSPRAVFAPLFESDGVILPEDVREGQYRIVETSTVAEVLDA